MRPVTKRAVQIVSLKYPKEIKQAFKTATTERQAVHIELPEALRRKMLC